MKRVFLYVRVSTEEQAIHGLSIEAQTSALEEWAKTHRHKVVGVYTDAGISARKPASKRPELQRLLSDAQAGKGDLIVFTKLDRWFRNIAEYYKVQEVLEKCKVDWKTIHEDYDTSTASGRLKINIMLSVAQDEADRDSERIRAVFDAKRGRKEPVTGHVPTGYKIEGKKVVKDPAMEAAVACFFENFLSYRSVEKARNAVREQCGVSFSYQLADSMLRKEAYYGCFGGVEGMCPPYITKEQYEAIRASRRRTERKSAVNRTYLFSGLVFCSECGRRFGSRAHMYQVKSGGTHESIAYNCPGRYHHNDCSNNVNITEAAIEQYLLDNIDAELERFVYDLESAAANYRPARNFQEERAKLRKKLLRLKDLYLDDIIDLELYRKDYEDLNAKLDELAIEESRAPAKPPSANRLREIFFDGWQDMYEQLERADKQAFWRLVIDKIVVHPTRQIAVFFRT